MTKNEVRAAQTKGSLIAAARRLFANDGYAQTSTDAILAGVGVKRGALYHHYRDKADLFEAVCRELAGEAASAIDAAATIVSEPFAQLEQGSIAWIDFMARPESRRILVIDAPGVLGRERWEALDRDLSFNRLQAGVEAAIANGAIRFSAGPAALAVLLNGEMNQIALRADDTNLASLKAGFVEMLRALKTVGR